MDQLIFASLSHTHYWYEVGMLKVPAVYIEKLERIQTSGASIHRPGGVVVVFGTGGRKRTSGEERTRWTKSSTRLSRTSINAGEEKYCGGSFLT